MRFSIFAFNSLLFVPALNALVAPTLCGARLIFWSRLFACSVNCDSAISQPLVQAIIDRKCKEKFGGQNFLKNLKLIAWIITRCLIGKKQIWKILNRHKSFLETDVSNWLLIESNGKSHTKEYLSIHLINITSEECVSPFLHTLVWYGRAESFCQQPTLQGNVCQEIQLKENQFLP